MKKQKHISGIRRIIGDVLLMLVVLLTVDVAVVMPHRIRAVVLKADYQEIFYYQLFLCAILLLFALDVRFNLFTRSRYMVIRIVGWVLRIAVVLFSTVIIFFCGKVMAGCMINTAGQADYALVLGLALENGEPAPDLLRRLDTAQAYLEKYPEAQLILTGGNADERGQTEADVMRELLTARGIPEDRLVIEDRAQSTVENFANIAKMIPADEPVVMISSNYHMDRAVRIAKQEGFSHVMRLPAPSGRSAFGANMMSEVVLNLNDLMKKISGSAVSETAEEPAPAHKVEVADQSVTTLKDDSGEYETIIPKIIVDGKEADSVNATLSEYIKKNHPMTMTEYGVNGETTRYAWGVRGDIVSIIIIASETFTDGVGYDIFNYNVDTLQPAGNDEVIRSLGMTADEFCNKAADAYRVFWNSRPYLRNNMSDLDKSIGAISSSSVTPFIMPNGNIGAAGRIYVSDSQFPESVRCFDLDTLEAEYFVNE